VALAKGPNDEEMVVVFHPPTCPISLLVTLFYPWMKQDLKGRLLLMLQTFSNNRWQSWTASPLNILDNVSSSGITASSDRWSTLKGAKV